MRGDAFAFTKNTLFSVKGEVCFSGVLRRLLLEPYFSFYYKIHPISNQKKSAPNCAGVGNLWPILYRPPWSKLFNFLLRAVRGAGGMMLVTGSLVNGPSMEQVSIPVGLMPPLSPPVTCMPPSHAPPSHAP